MVEVGTRRPLRFLRVRIWFKSVILYVGRKEGKVRGKGWLVGGGIPEVFTSTHPAVNLPTILVPAIVA